MDRPAHHLEEGYTACHAQGSGLPEEKGSASGHPWRQARIPWIRQRDRRHQTAPTGCVSKRRYPAPLVKTLVGAELSTEIASFKSRAW